MKHILIFLLGCFLLLASEVSAQDEAIYNHYINNHFLINPGAAGYVPDEHRIFFNYRSQWAGFPGSPHTYTLSYHNAFVDRFGLGAMISTDRVASLQKIRFVLAPTFRYQIEKMSLGLGLTGEFHRYQLSSDVIDENIFFSADDPELQDLFDGISNFDVSLGIYGRLDDQLFFGLTLPNLIKNRLDEIEVGGDSTSNTPFKYITGILGYRLALDGKGQMYLEPSVVYKKIRTAPAMIDFNLMAGFMDEKILTGLTYTAGTDGALGIYLGTRYNTVQVMYSHHIYMGDFQRYNSGTHEISVGLQLTKKGKRTYDRTRKYRGN